MCFFLLYGYQTSLADYAVWWLQCILHCSNSKSSTGTFDFTNPCLSNRLIFSWISLSFTRWWPYCNVICISTTCMLHVFYTLTVFMLVLMIEVQKGCNGVVDIYLSEQPPGQIILITEDALYIVIIIHEALIRNNNRSLQRGHTTVMYIWRMVAVWWMEPMLLLSLVVMVQSLSTRAFEWKGLHGKM